MEIKITKNGVTIKCVMTHFDSEYGIEYDTYLVSDPKDILIDDNVVNMYGITNEEIVAEFEKRKKLSDDVAKFEMGQGI